MNKIAKIMFWHDREVFKDKIFEHSALKAQAASLKIAVLSLLKPILNTDKVNSYAETKCLPPLLNDGQIFDHRICQTKNCTNPKFEWFNEDAGSPFTTIAAGPTTATTDTSITVASGTGLNDGQIFDHRICLTTACFVVSKRLTLPNAFLCPETLYEKGAALLGGQDIDFDNDDVFSDRFTLQGPSEVNIRDYFKKKLRNELCRIR